MKIEFVPFEYVGAFKLDDDVDNYSDILVKYRFQKADEYGDEYYYSPDYQPYY